MSEDRFYFMDDESQGFMWLTLTCVGTDGEPWIGSVWFTTEDINDAVIYGYNDAFDNLREYGIVREYSPADEVYEYMRDLYLNHEPIAVGCDDDTIDTLRNYITDHYAYIAPGITGADMPEFCANIIETFEDFLEERGTTLHNPERIAAIQAGEDPESVALIYGTDYGELQSAIEDIMRRWRLTL